MAATPYKPVSWSPNELITEDKLDQIANNSQWLFENTPRVSYNAFNLNRTTGVKIACGTVLFNGSKTAYQTKPVYFSNFFSAASKPIVTTGVISFQRRTFVVTNGFGVYSPDSRGFEMIVECESTSVNKIERDFYVSWMAMGF
jgi:hypothetical protein